MNDLPEQSSDQNSTAGLSRRELRQLRSDSEGGFAAVVDAPLQSESSSQPASQPASQPGEAQPAPSFEAFQAVSDATQTQFSEEVVIEADGYQQDQFQGDLFPLTHGISKGYEPRAVEAFLSVARTSFESVDSSPVLLTSADVRAVSFPMIRRGYVPEKVDQALARIEDAFAQRERAEVIAQHGSKTWVVQAREQAQEVLDRLTRPNGERFKRTGFWHYGYRIDEVDQISDRIARYLAFGEPLQVDQLRQVAFSTQRNGYREDQVDAVIDRTIEIVLAVS